MIAYASNQLAFDTMNEKATRSWLIAILLLTILLCMSGTLYLGGTARLVQAVLAGLLRQRLTHHSVQPNAPIGKLAA